MKATKPRESSERDQVARLIREIGKLVDRACAKQANEPVPIPSDRPSVVAHNRVKRTVTLDDQAIDYGRLYRTEPMERVDLLKRGIPATWVPVLATSMGVSTTRTAVTLGLAPGAISRKLRRRVALSIDEGARVLALARLVGQVQVAVDQSGDSAGFNAAQWVARWIDEPLAALGGRAPADLMDTPDGQGLVSALICRMQSGSYS